MRNRLGLFLSVLSLAGAQLPTAVLASPVAVNDTFANTQWYLDAIHAREGWNMTTGTRDVVVAVIDTGVDITHPDLKANIWKNPNEVAANGKDDDGDGYIDDINGWNFVSNSNDVGPVADADTDPESWLHGTAVASLIGAVGNNDQGMTGVAWKVRIMPIVALASNGFGRDDLIIRSIHYAVAHGADIINLSLVGYDFDDALALAIREASSQGVLVVSAAGNSEDVKGENMDLTPGYPACDRGAGGGGTLTVTSVDRANLKAEYANYGDCVDVSAPGDDIFAARPQHEANEPGAFVAAFADHLSGTSVAAPLATGLAALLKSEHPSWTSFELARRIIDTSDPVNSTGTFYAGKIGHGRINVARALAKDAAAAALGPFTLEVSTPGQAPRVRILGAQGQALKSFPVGNTTDRRGVRAAYVRWSDRRHPDIMVTTNGDTKGAWRVYRDDGVLLAAGEVGKVAGGLGLATQDLNASGYDDVLLYETGGSRAWMISVIHSSPLPVAPFSKPAKGLSAVSISRPAAGFLVASRSSDQQVAIVGRGGLALARGPASKPNKKALGWNLKRAARQGGGSAYVLGATTGDVMLVNDGSGLSPREVTDITNWTQASSGIPLNRGWLMYDSWPR